MRTRRVETAATCSGTALAAILVLCSPGGPARAEMRAPASHRLLVGLLTKQADRQCLGMERVRWVHPRHEIGFVRLRAEGPSLEELEGLEGRIVIAEGSITAPSRRTPVFQSDGCSPVQMRADWVEGPNGVRIRHDESAGLGLPLTGFLVTGIRPFDGLLVTPAGDDLEVRFRNPIDVTLENVTLTLHYEGCYGKPDAAVRHAVFPRLPAGETAIATFPRLARRSDLPPDRRLHRAYSIQVEAPSEQVAFDLDVPLHHFDGVDIRCPADRPVKHGETEGPGD